MLKTHPYKIVLCATAKNLLAGVWHSNQLQNCHIFVNDDEGRSAFTALLNQHQEAPIYLIVNAVEEDYRLESLPHSTGAAKRELIERKLNQFYRGMVYKTAHFIQREKDKRKDDKFLFVALNNEDFMQDWMTIIQSVEARLVGIYLLPMLSQVLMKRLKLMAPHILFCEKLSSGLRQSYMHNGRLRMSRLIPNLPNDDKQLGYYYLVETQKTRLYLMSKRFISRDISLNLQLVSINDDMQAIMQSFSQEPGIDCEVVYLDQIAKDLNLNTATLDKMPELVHMQLLADGNLVDNLAPISLIKQFQLNKIKQWLQLAMLSIGILGSLVSAWFFVGGLDQQSAFNQAKQDTLLETQRYQEIARNFPKTNIKSHDLSLAVTLHRHIENFAKSPERAMRVVSDALETLHEVTLISLHWQQTNDINAQEAPNKNDDTVLFSKQNVPATQTILPSLPPNQLAELIFVNAQMANFNGDYRHALDVANQLVARLKQHQDVENVQLLQAPVNVNSYANVHGNTNETQANNKASAVFKIKILLKAAPTTRQ